MSQDDVALVREAFDAFLGGDLEKATQLVDPEVEFQARSGASKRVA